MAVASTAKLINYPSYNPIKNPFKTSSSKGKEHGIAKSREIFNWLLELVRDINWIPLLLSCINRPSLVFRFVDNLTFKKKRGRKENTQKSVFLSTAFFRFEWIDAKKYIIKKKVCMITRLGKERNIVRFNFCPHLNCLKFQVRTDDDFHGNYTRKL